MAQIKLRGTPVNTNGNFPAVGSAAPDFSLVDADLNNVSLANYAGKTKVLSIVPSLDTPVCATSSKVFNERITGRGDTVVLIVSADLPFAQKRFCNDSKLSNIVPLSMMRSRNFAKDYGVLLTDGPLAGITARAVVVIDKNNKVVHSQLVPDISQEPDYDAALKTLG